jgi:hypothetical protein
METDSTAAGYGFTIVMLVIILVSMGFIGMILLSVKRNASHGESAEIASDQDIEADPAKRVCTHDDMVKKLQETRSPYQGGQEQKK